MVEPPRRPDRRGAWLRAGLSALALVSAFVVGWFVTLPGISLCAFQVYFGRPCPGCGMTRSIARLSHGDVVASLRFHPLGVVLFAATVLGLVGGALEIRGHRDPFWNLLDRHGTWLAATFVVALFGLWIVRAFVVPEWSPDPVGHPIGWDVVFGAR